LSGDRVQWQKILGQNRRLGASSGDVDDSEVKIEEAVGFEGSARMVEGDEAVEDAGSVEVGLAGLKRNVEKARVGKLGKK